MLLILVSLCGLISCVSRHKHLLVHLSCHSITKTKQVPFSPASPEATAFARIWAVDRGTGASQRPGSLPALRVVCRYSPVGFGRQHRVINKMATSGIPFFMEIFIIAAWEIWNLRNSKNFDHGSPTVHLWTWPFKDQVYLQLVRVREDQGASIIQ